MSKLLPEPEVMRLAVQGFLPDYAQIQWVEELDSTNTQLLEFARTAPTKGSFPCLLGAHHQQDGRGRNGRQWVDRQDSTLIFSVAIEIQLPATQLPMLAPICGIVACEQLRQCVKGHQKNHLSMKWPNDILFDDAKLSGLLIEVTRPKDRVSDDHHVVVVGMGMNLEKAYDLSQSLQRPIADWASVISDEFNSHAKETCTMPQLVANIAHAWCEAFDSYKKEGFAPFLSRHHAVDALYQKEVDVVQDGRVLFHGVAQGLDEQAYLLVQTARGLERVITGDVSIRTKVF